MFIMKYNVECGTFVEKYIVTTTNVVNVVVRAVQSIKYVPKWFI